MYKSKEQKAITLIALIITIIVLLILAGVTINVLIGENGLFKTANDASNKYSKAAAREKLEAVLMDVQINRIIKPQYNDEDLNMAIQQNNMKINGDIVTVDGWQFQIDKTIPQIMVSLENGKESNDIVINHEMQYSANYKEEKIIITISSLVELSTVKINNENVMATNNNDGTYTVEKIINNNGTYSVYVEDIKNEYKVKNIRIIGLEQDLIIWTDEELKEFANLVNSGREYEGKTITLGASIDLSNICHKESETISSISWTPIGNESKPFKGIFNGNKKTITGLYINSNSSIQGLFGFSDGGQFKDLNIVGIVSTSRQ